MRKMIRKKESLPDSIIYQITFTANFTKSFRRIFHSKYMGEEVNPDEFAILVLLNENPEYSQAELSKILFKGKAHTGKLLNEMENRGFIKRTSQNCSNSVKNIVTEKGQNIYKKGINEINRSVLSALDKEFTEQENLEFMSYLIRFRKTLSSILDVKLK